MKYLKFSISCVIVTDAGTRTNADVAASNLYAFPSTNLSLEHASGWHSINRVALDAGVEHPELLNATRMRHLVSTLYAALDVPQADRQLFFKHMGHSENVNLSVYQAPLTLQEVTRVGVHLQSIDTRGMPTVSANQSI